jgi:hypothetical protein
VYHFVHGYGAVGYCDEADDYAVDVVPGLYEHLVVRSKVVVAYATVLFFSLYLACIWSILGTWPCRDSFVVVSHRRAGVKVALRVRCNRGSDRAQDAHVQEFKDRSDWFRRGDVNDIFGCELRLERTLGEMMRASKFAAGIYRFGTTGAEELGSWAFLSRARGRHLRHLLFAIFILIDTRTSARNRNRITPHIVSTRQPCPPPFAASAPPSQRNTNVQPVHSHSPSPSLQPYRTP